MATRGFGFRQRKSSPGGARLSRRNLIMMGAQLAVAGGLAWRMRQLQVIETDHYRLLAEENRINIRLIPPSRGQIFDRNGEPLAVNSQNYRVVMIREQAGDPDAMLTRLGALIEIPPHQRRKILKDLSTNSAFVPVTVAEHLTWRDFAEVNANAPALPGILPEVGLSREYPHGEATAHVIGYVSAVTEKDLERDDADDPVLLIPEFQIGKTGIERAEERRLRGTAGQRQIEVNSVGRVIRELDRTEGIAGDDLHLTVDMGLQLYALDRVKDESAAVVVMDIQNGDLVALASSPNFNPNSFVVGIGHDEWNSLLNNEYRPLSNKWASGMYPPGSTFKMVVALAALEAGVIGPGEGVYCPGRMKLGNRYFHCWRRGGHGHVALRQSLQQSCDVYYYELAKRAGIEAIGNMARRLGLGVDLNLPIPALKSGLIPTKQWKVERHGEDWTVGDSLNSGIGQGFVLATPLQLAVMTARIASGKNIEPRLIRARDGNPVPVPEAPDLGIRTEHLRWVRDGMFSVVNERRGTAYRSRIADKTMAMAGKTGTSQVRNITAAERARGVTRNDQLPWNRRDHALFVAFAPYDAPRYAVSVVVEHGGGGSKAAAPIARDVMMRTLYGPRPPLEAYPPAERGKIKEMREAEPLPEPEAAPPPGERRVRT